MSFALVMLLATAASASAQAMAPPVRTGTDQVVVSLGPLSTGSITQGEAVGHIGLFSSDLPRTLEASPEAERYARIFARNVRVARPLLLVGAGLAVGALTAYVSRHGDLGMGGREMAAFGAGGIAFMYGANRMDAAHQALRSAVQEYNHTTADR